MNKKEILDSIKLMRQMLDKIEAEINPAPVEPGKIKRERTSTFKQDLAVNDAAGTWRKPNFLKGKN